MKLKTISLAVLGCFALNIAHAQGTDERASLESLRKTTLNLIEMLVETGALTREKADSLIRKAEAEADAAATVAQQPKPSDPVRVQYVPEIVKKEIREQLKQEVMAQARTERWAEPNSIPFWLDRITWEGDLRLRYQMDQFDEGNAMPFAYASAAGTNAPPTQPGDSTRAADFTRVNSLLVPTANTTDDRERFRLRARLGVLAKIGDEWSAGIRLATGSATDRVSTNQTLGQDFNKYSLFVDRAFVRYDPTEWLTISGGRIPNPWFSTDLVWDEDINFEGIAATFRHAFANDTIKPFVTIGSFPVKEENPPASQKMRWLHGMQAGTQWDIDSKSRLKIGLAWYDYRDFEGQVESAGSLTAVTSGGSTVLLPSDPSYGQFEYGAGLRQKGNTLFTTNAPGDGGSTAYWGLASRFRPLNLTTSLDLAHFDPVHVVLTADWVKNTEFDKGEIFDRTQGRVDMNQLGGKDYGYLAKLTLGMPKFERPHDWQVSLAYRYLGSDAVVDAFTDSDFGLGGTNLKGYQIGAQYAIDPRATVGLRWMSADSIESFTTVPGDKFSVDVIQADVNVRF